MEKFGRYRIEGELGRGLATTVYRAEETPGGRPVALKLFQLSFAPGSLEEKAWLVRFRRETEGARRILHPAVVQLYEADVFEGQPYVALELVEGATLAQALASVPIELARKIEIAAEVSGALAAAHEMGVLHLSLRPSNVFLDRHGQVKVADFGELDLLAAEAGAPADGIVPQQVHYRAPEQIYGRRADARTDVFALGILLYELSYRKKPFEGDSWFQVTHKILNQAPPRLRDSSAEAPIALIRILDHALAKDPSERYRNARELQRDLLAACQSLRRSSSADGVAAAQTEESSPCLPGPGSDLPPSTGQAFLLVHDGEFPRAQPLLRERFTLGRKSDNDLVFVDESISRYHALLECTPDGWAISDRRSRHGTLVNDRRLSSRLVLRDGDRIDLGHTRRARMTFRSGTPGTEVSRPSGGRQTDIPTGFLLDASRALNSSLDLDAVLNVILDCALGFTLAERGFLLLRDIEGALRIHRGRRQGGLDVEPGAENVSMTVVNKCAESDEPVVVRDASEDAEIATQQSIIDLRLRSILCLPLIAKAKLLGVLYLDSRDTRPTFAEGHHELLRAFSEHAAAAIENARLYKVATRDECTGLYRHDYFEDRLTEEFNRAAADGHPLALVFADVDHFKAVNDVHGHPAGNRVLSAVGALFSQHARPSDVAARFGGEEFVLLVPEAGPEDARVTAERLREQAANLQVDIGGGKTIAVTLSFGVAGYPGEGIASGAELVDAADRALYSAKEGGRNRVVVFGRT